MFVCKPSFFSVTLVSSKTLKSLAARASTPGIAPHAFDNSFEFDTTNLTRIVASLSLKEFNELKLHFNNDNKLKELFDKFQKYREKLQAEKEAEAKKKEGCYIATMVYEHYDHPSVLELRLFRDMTLKRNTFGRKFIELYYKYSPVFVNYVKDKNLLKASAAIIIKVIVRVVNLWNILINR